MGRSEMSVGCSENLEPIARAQGWARRLVETECRKHGIPIRNGAARVARRVKASASSITALIYSPPKDIGANLFEALRAAVEGEILSEIEALHHELELARQGGVPDRIPQIETISADLEALRARVLEIAR